MLIKENFVYHKPNSIEQACSIIMEHWGQVRLLAGGTDLIIRMKADQWKPKHVVDLKNIGLNKIEADSIGVSIKATVTLTEIEEAKTIKEYFPALAEAVEVMASVQVRNRATLAGNLCNAAPSCDTAPPLIAYGAVAKIQGEKTSRSIILEDFFISPGATVLEQGELLYAIEIPFPEKQSGCAYTKYARTSKDLAVVGVAAYLALDQSGTVKNIKIVLGAVAPTPIRAKQAEEILKGKKISELIVDQAANKASLECSPISDVRAQAEYRRELVQVLTKRSIFLAYERAMLQGEG